MTEDRAYIIKTALRNIKLTVSDAMNEQLKPRYEDIENAVDEDLRESEGSRYVGTV